MFRGINNVIVDAKGRVAVPVRYRELLERHCHGELVVTIDTQERSLLVYPRPEWEIIESKVQALSSIHPETRKLQRLLIGHATDVDLDGSGRLLIPPPLREYAGLDKKAILIGQSNKLELFAEENWVVRREDWLNQEGGPLPPELESLSL